MLAVQYLPCVGFDVVCLPFVRVNKVLIVHDDVHRGVWCSGCGADCPVRMSLPQYGLGMGVGVKPEQAVTHALKQLQSCTPMVRLRAREALLDMPAKALTPYIDQITQVIDARDARARQTALLLLQRLPTTSVSSVLPQVIPALEDLDTDVQRAALDVLRNFTPSVCSRYGEHIVHLYERR